MDPPDHQPGGWMPSGPPGAYGTPDPNITSYSWAHPRALLATRSHLARVHDRHLHLFCTRVTTHCKTRAIRGPSHTPGGGELYVAQKLELHRATRGDDQLDLGVGEIITAPGGGSR